MSRLIYRVATVAIMAVTIFSCGGVKKAKQDLIYLREGSLDTLPNLVFVKTQSTIQKDDILNISVFSDNQEATSQYNQNIGGPIPGSIPSNSASANGGGSQASGYLVDENGDIRFPGIGRIKANGLTRRELTDTLEHRLATYLQNPVVDVRFLNNRITVMGEVQKPGVYTIPTDKISILEVLGVAGDLTIYANKSNVLIIRETAGKRSFGRLDLRRTDIFQSPYYFLQQNDLVIVEPNNKKQTATEQDNLRKLTLVTALATFVSTISILVTLFK